MIFPVDFTGFAFTVEGDDSATFSGSFGETGTAVSVNKNGEGMLTLTGTNAFTGFMTVEDGTLVNDGLLSSTVVVGDGAILAALERRRV